MGRDPGGKADMEEGRRREISRINRGMIVVPSVGISQGKWGPMCCELSNAIASGEKKWR